MKCPNCGNTGVIHHGRQCDGRARCVECGDAFSPEFYMQSSEQVPLMRELGICFCCALWELRAREGMPLVIDGRAYGLGSNTMPGPFCGMAGRWFDIEFFDGRRVRTCDLFSGGEIPERFRDRLPDTARFLGGAGFRKIGDGGGWDASANQSDKS